MKRPVSVGTRKEVLRALAVRYQNARRSVKARILDELVAITGYHRKHAIRVLRIPKHMDHPATEQSRSLIYDEAVREALIVVWEVADRICSRRLKAIIPCLVESMDEYK